MKPDTTNVRPGRNLTQPRRTTVVRTTVGPPADINASTRPAAAADVDLPDLTDQWFDDLIRQVDEATHRLSDIRRAV